MVELVDQADLYIDKVPNFQEQVGWGTRLTCTWRKSCTPHQAQQVGADSSGTGCMSPETQDWYHIDVDLHTQHKGSTKKLGFLGIIPK